MPDMATADRSELEGLVSALTDELRRRSAMVATAESLTGGGLGQLLSAAPGSSDTYLGGVISYATDLKLKLLGVSPETVRDHGVVSAQCAAEMALGVGSLTGADYSVSTTGVAGPAEQEGKPAGMLFIAVAGPGGVLTRGLHLDGDRAMIRAETCHHAVSAVLEVVRAADPGAHPA